MNNEWKKRLTAAVKKYIETDRACRANPCGYQSCGPRDTPEWKEYARLSEEYRKAKTAMWEITDVEYDVEEPYAAAWEWRYWHVMSRKCCFSQLTTGNTVWAGETMTNLETAERNLACVCGLKDLYEKVTK